MPSIQQAELIVHGYCHELQVLLTAFSSTIPVEIIDLCLLFYQTTSIITIAVGKCGNALNTNLFQSILKEYKNGHHEDTYLGHNGNSTDPSPRCIAIDGDKSASDPTCDPANKIGYGHIPCGKDNGGCGNIWAKGMYTDGMELADATMECLRKDIESYDDPQAIQIMHSISAGTGLLLALYFQFD